MAAGVYFDEAELRRLGLSLPNVVALRDLGRQQGTSTDQLSSLQSSTENLTSLVTEARTDISDLEARTSAAETNISTLKSKDENLDFRLLAAETQLQGAQPAIQLKDEGASIGGPGGVRVIDFVGAGVSAAVSGFTATVTIPGGGGGFSSISPNTQTANYTLTISDVGGVVRANASSAVTVTVPANATAAIPVGSVVYIRQVGDGRVTVTGESGVTLSAADTTTTRAKFSELRLHKVGTNDWEVTGDAAMPSSLYGLMLHCDGPEGIVRFKDDGRNDLQVSSLNVTHAGAQRAFGSTSARFNANGYLTVPYHADISLNSTPWTISMFIRTETSGSTFMDFRGSNPAFTAGWGFYLLGGVLCLYDGVTATNFTSGPTLTLNAWQHLEVTRDASGVIRFFLDGALHGTALTLNVPATDPTGLRIGAQNDLSPWAYFQGNIDELRIVKGIAEHVSSFTPPTGPYR